MQNSRGVQALRSLQILHRRGLVSLGHPLSELQTLRDAGRFGPFAATALRAARRHPGAPALADGESDLTYGQLAAQGMALARSLRERGIGPDERVGLLCRDHRGMLLSLIAAGLLGARAVLLNTGFAKPQLEDVVRREGIAAMLLDAEFAELSPAIPRVLTRGTAGGGDLPTLDELIADSPPGKLPRPPHGSGGLVLLTSGTTGTPKGAPRKRISPLQSAQLLDRIPLAPGGAEVIATPLFHGTGLGQLALALALGKEVVLRPARFDPEATLADVAAHRADTLVLVPTMLRRMLELGQTVRARYDTSSLRIVVCAGSSLSPDLARRAADWLGDLLYNVYGSTEAANVAVATPAELRRAPGTVGRAPVGCRLALYDEHRRPVSEADTPGVIFASNGLSFGGYTDGSGKEVVDGMLSTGDVGHFDRDGLLFVDGRDDQMIVSGGENVFPQEVEDLVLSRGDVGDAAVVGVADSDFGQRLRVFVVPRPGAVPDAEEIKRYVGSRLARHKVPRDVVFLDEIPRTPAGKLPLALLDGRDQR